MKSAIYIEDGAIQLVLTPETDHEKALLRLYEDGEYEATAVKGTFYRCRGGWMVNNLADHYSQDMSLIVRMSAK